MAPETEHGILARLYRAEQDIQHGDRHLEQVKTNIANISTDLRVISVQLAEEVKKQSERDRAIDRLNQRITYVLGALLTGSIGLIVNLASHAIGN